MLVTWLRCVPLYVCGVSVLVVAGCTRPVDYGRTLYANGHYVEAAAVFEQGEGKMRESPAREKAQYGTYRGLTLLVLGDLNQARRWLAYAYAIEQQSPGSLSPMLRASLDRGWHDLQVRLAQEQAPPPSLGHEAPAEVAETPVSGPALATDAPAPPRGQGQGIMRRSFMSP